MSDSYAYDLVRGINEVKDNIWLRDYTAARQIVNATLEKTSYPQISELKEEAEKIRQQTYKLRKTAAKEKIKNSGFWVRSQLSKSLMERQVDPVAMIPGVYLIQLLAFKELLTVLTEKEHQTTLNGKIVRSKDDIIVVRKKDYKYTLDYFTNRWIARAISEKEWDSAHLQQLQKFAEEKDVFLDKSEIRCWHVFELFGKDMHIQIVGSDRVIEISIMLPRLKIEGDMAKSLTERILDSFA